MSACEKYIEQISLLVDCELTAEQESELRTHIENCAECRRVYDAFIGISSALSENFVEPPEMLAKGIMFKIGFKNKSEKRHFAFGRFTAIAACFALILFGASYFGLLDSSDKDSEKSAAAPKVSETESYSLSESGNGSEPVEEAKLEASYGIQSADTDQSTLTSGEANTENSEGEVFQLGFATRNMNLLNRNINTETYEVPEEPASIFGAKELVVYEGKYYFEEENKDKNTLLTTANDEEDLSAISELLTAISDNGVYSTVVDSNFTDYDPEYTLFVPADKKKDENAKDQIISVWFVDGEIWCLIEDAITNSDSNDNSNTEKILYKAEGLQEEFELLITQAKAST